MADKPEEKARAEIDRPLRAAGPLEQNHKAADLHAASGVGLLEFQRKDRDGEADYVLYDVAAKAVSVIDTPAHLISEPEVWRAGTRTSALSTMQRLELSNDAVANLQAAQVRISALVTPCAPTFNDISRWSSLPLD